MKLRFHSLSAALGASVNILCKLHLTHWPFCRFIQVPLQRDRTRFFLLFTRSAARQTLLRQQLCVTSDCHELVPPCECNLRWRSGTAFCFSTRSIDASILSTRRLRLSCGSLKRPLPFSLSVYQVLTRQIQIFGDKRKQRSLSRLPMFPN